MDRRKFIFAPVAATAVSGLAATTRQEAANDWISRLLERPPEIENAGALVPFFAQLAHLETDPARLLRIYQYGDSHTAADEWTGTLRYLLQARFGDGGPGYLHPGSPWKWYRRLETKSTASPNWTTSGLPGRPTDGFDTPSGISISTLYPQQYVALQADATRASLWYVQQPGGGRVEVSVNGNPLEIFSSDGPLQPAFFEFSMPDLITQLEARTLDQSPVRLQGWITENSSGVVYDMYGINGAQASILKGGHDECWARQFARRMPALVVLAYGTNEARSPLWSYESYRTMFEGVLQRFRRFAPTASFLVVGPPDHSVRNRRQWMPHPGLDAIIRAQRDAAMQNGAAFLDLRNRLGGPGAMNTWVNANLAQADHVHFTGPGYRILGATLYRDVLTAFELFKKTVREAAHQPAPMAKPVILNQ